MTKEQAMETVNKEFKLFFTERGFRVRKDCNGMKATSDDCHLTFYIDYDCFGRHFSEEHNVDSKLLVKLPYTSRDFARYFFKLNAEDITVNLDMLKKLFTDQEFLALTTWKLPDIISKFL